MRKIVFTILLLVTFPALAGNKIDVPQLVILDGNFELSLPNSFLKKIKADFPSLALPDSKNMPSWQKHWATTSKGLPYICWGDFNGDKSIDISAILIDRSGKRGVWVTYHSSGKNYVQKYKYTYKPDEESPYDDAIETISKEKGFTYNSDKVIHRMYENDAIALTRDEGAVTVKYFENGHYKLTAFGSY